MTCAIHCKSRKSSYLEEFAPGQYKCIPGYECKVSGDGTPAFDMYGNPVQGASDEIVVCHAHGKKRKASVCTQIYTETGMAWECTLAHRCKGATTDTNRYSPYARPEQQEQRVMSYGTPSPVMYPPTPGVANMAPMGGPGPGAGGGDSIACAVHGKMRRMNYMQEVTPGVPGAYRCRFDAECKGGGASAGAGPGGMSTGFGGMSTGFEGMSAGAGSMSVMPRMPLVVAPSGNGTCTLHGRSRRMAYLQQDPATGMLTCTPGNECKTGTAS